MTKEFIPYQQGLQLKELGFDEPCFGYWKSKNWLIQEKTRTDGYTHADQECSAPLYQQVFRWFREKHQIEAIVSCIYSKTLDISYEERRYHCYIVRNGITTKGTKFKTYEEAENVCLNKLIEICKNK